MIEQLFSNVVTIAVLVASVGMSLFLLGITVLTWWRHDDWDLMKASALITACWVVVTLTLFNGIICPECLFPYPYRGL